MRIDLDQYNASKTIDISNFKIWKINDQGSDLAKTYMYIFVVMPVMMSVILLVLYQLFT